MVMLSGLDFGLIGAYFVVLLLIGYFSSRKQNEDDYLIAERNLGAWSTMATINASKTGAILMIFVALVYGWGFSAMWYFIGMAAGVFVFLPFALKLKESSAGKFYTLADYFKYHFGKKVAKFASLITIFLMFGFLVLSLMAGAKLFVFFTGWPFWLCASVMVIIVLAYLLSGGFRAVVKTDILQYIAMIFILMMLAIVMFSGSLVSVSEWGLFNADIVSIVGFFLAGILFPFALPDIWQRVYSSRDKSSLKRGLILAAVVYLLVAILLALVALTIKAKFPGLDPDLALVHGFANLLPAGLLGLSVVLLFAALMSSIDTYLFTGASAIIQDWFDWDKGKVVRGLKKVIFGLAVVGTLVSIIIQDLIIGSYIFVALSAVLAVVVIASWVNRKVSQRTLIWGLSVGTIGFFVFLFSTLQDISPMIVIIALVSTLAGLGIGGLVSLFKR